MAAPLFKVHRLGPFVLKEDKQESSFYYLQDCLLFSWSDVVIGGTRIKWPALLLAIIAWLLLPIFPLTIYQLGPLTPEVHRDGAPLSQETQRRLAVLTTTAIGLGVLDGKQPDV